MDFSANNGNDETDKWPNPFRRKSKQKSPKQVSSNVIPTSETEIDSDEYSMKFPLGKCLIFNHKIFSKYPERKGTEKDVKRLYNLFRKLGFNEVKLYEDYTVGEVMETLTEVAQEDHAENSCLVCCILTHGNEGLLCARDGIYYVKELYNIFNGNKSPGLRDKPKIFFIQACQGYKADSGVEVNYEESMDSVVKIPTYADFLIMFSTFPGFVSFKNEDTGSYFIQCLCNVLEEHAENKHLMDMLTIVTHRVAFYFESKNLKEKCKDKKKQVPYITTTLTRKVKFPSKMSS